MRPNLDYSKLIEIVERFEENQTKKIFQLKELQDVQLLKDYLTIPDTLFTEELQQRLADMSTYIDKQSSLYQELKAKYDLDVETNTIMKGIEDLLLKGDIDKEVADNLLKDQHFIDVVYESILGQFANDRINQPRFNLTDFDTRIQIGGKAELIQIIKRVFWAAEKNKDPKGRVKVTIAPVGSGGRDEDILLTFLMTNNKGTQTKKATLREDVKSNLENAYLRSGTVSDRLIEIIKRNIHQVVKRSDGLYIRVQTDELFDAVAEILGQKYGAVYNNGEWRANSPVFFTTPDGSIMLGSEMLKTRDFEIKLTDEMTKYAIKHGYMGGNGYGN